MDKVTKMGKKKLIPSYVPSIMKLSDFGKKLSPKNFLTSIEYKYVLKDLKLEKMRKIVNGNKEYGIRLEYPNKDIRLTQKPSCLSTGKTTESEFSCGFLWTNTCIGTYAHYNCKGDTSLLSKVEQHLNSSTKISKILKKGWTYQPMISRRNKVSQASPNSGIRENQCYKISEYGPRNVCLKGTKTDACYGLKDYALRKVCLEGTGGNACYAFDDYARRKICLEGIRTDACYSISNNYNKQRSCQNFSGDTDFWLIISSHGYYTWK
jgi:hypothetical protein